MNFRKLLQKIRIFKYALLSDTQIVQGKPKLLSPVQFVGDGKISFGHNVSLGYFPSPFFYNSYIYIEARSNKSKIVFGDNVMINNASVFISDGEGIEIGNDTIMGTNCEVIDSDFHDLNPDSRHTGKSKMAKITIGKNVFLGNNVKILKGVTIGDNTVVANGSIVTKSIPKNVIAGGCPCEVIRKDAFKCSY